MDKIINTPTLYVNIELIDCVGLNAAIVLTQLDELKSRYNSGKDKFFYYKKTALAARCGLSLYAIKTNTAFLEKQGFIKTKVQGAQTITHYKINEKKLDSIKIGYKYGLIKTITATMDGKVSLYLAHMIRASEHFEKDKLEDGYFKQPQKKIKDMIGMDEKVQRKCLKVLEHSKMLEKKDKRYKICSKNINMYVENMPEYSWIISNYTEFLGCKDELRKFYVHKINQPLENPLEDKSKIHRKIQQKSTGKTVQKEPKTSGNSCAQKPALFDFYNLHFSTFLIKERKERKKRKEKLKIKILSNSVFYPQSGLASASGLTPTKTKQPENFCKKGASQVNQIFANEENINSVKKVVKRKLTFKDKIALAKLTKTKPLLPKLKKKVSKNIIIPKNVMLLINIWNSHPELCKFTKTSRDTKIFEQTIQSLKWFLKGSLYTTKDVIYPDWYKNQKIDYSVSGFADYVEKFVFLINSHGFYPIDKKPLTKVSLNVFLRGNMFSKASSSLLALCIDSPRPIKKIKHPEEVEYLQELFTGLTKKAEYSTNDLLLLDTCAENLIEILTRTGWKPLVGINNFFKRSIKHSWKDLRKLKISYLASDSFKKDFLNFLRWDNAI